MRGSIARLRAAGAEAAASGAHLSAAFFSPIAQLLGSGGDARLRIDPESRLNGYGCRPFPRPEAFTFASSTATSISDRGYARATHARLALIRSSLTCSLKDAFDRRVEQMRHELRGHLLLEPSVDVVFSPSGTDSQLHAVCVARSLLGPRCTSVIAAADETGSGTAFTSEGRHFGESTAQGISVAKGAPLAGFVRAAARIAVPMHDERGALRDEHAIDASVLDAVAAVVAGGGRVLLHAMDSSKCGRRSPSLACLHEVCARWPESVLVLVDACQLRCGRARLADYLKKGYLVILTGSKFFTGPPFSGALLVPGPLSLRLAANGDLAAGIGDYANRSDWPQRWSKIRGQLPDRMNFGQWLRWEAALEEMRAYFAVPQEFRRTALERFSAFVRERLARSSSLTLLPTRRAELHEGMDDEEMSVGTIFPFLTRREGVALKPDQCTSIYKMLNQDASHLLPETASLREKALAAQPCHIGQPVPQRQSDGTMTAVLRVSAGARVVSESWSADSGRAQANLQSEFDQIAMIFDKIELLLRVRSEL